jgi:raffinose synthase
MPTNYFLYSDKGFIFHNDILFSEFSVKVKLELRDPLALARKSIEQSTGTDRLGDFTLTTLNYTHEEERMDVKLQLRCYRQYTLLSVYGKIHHDQSFKAPRTFEPVNGITVELKKGDTFSSLLANYQHKTWWTRPHFDTDVSQLPAKTLSLLVKTRERYYHVLPVTGTQYRTDLSGYEDGIAVNISTHQSGRNECITFACVIGADEDPYKLVKRQVDTALEELQFPILSREQKHYPEILEYLGWCSWDAFYQDVSEQGLLAKRQELEEKQLPVRWFIIDDGWLDTADSKLKGFGADRSKFPQGLTHTIRKLKENHGLRWVGVWHTIVGYWEGVHPDSALAYKHKEHLLMNARGSLIPYPDASKAFGFWHDWHSQLSREGVDFVKADGQSEIYNFLQYHMPIGEAASAAHQALEASVALHFNHTIINCMGMSSENIWHRPKSAISRNSDDFFPKEARGFQEHALQNAYNSYYHGTLYYGDWDMFWTENHDDVQNAVLRSISGGPVYFSDAVGKTNPQHVWPLIYQDGKIIRCDQPANPTTDCLTTNPTEVHIPLKLWNTNGSVGVVSAFHIHPGALPVKGAICLADVPALNQTHVYALYEHFSEQVRWLSGQEAHELQLAVGQCELYLLIPRQLVVTPIGLLDKYVSSDAIVKQWTKSNSTFVQLKEGGRFGFISESVPVTVYMDGVSVAFSKIGEVCYEVQCLASNAEVTIEIVI